ncbi:MAG TPA: hypothetical protein VHW43_09045 [Puia sp.]|jgi:hypothetical protein|nr:hypothetical protein [Puia sp.]
MPRNLIIGDYPDPPVDQPQPNLRRSLFWDVRFDKLDWQVCSEYVIERVLDMGSDADLAELVRYYGRRKVLHILKKRPIFLMDRSIQRACTFFKLKPEELRCYTRKQSRPGHWL